MVDKRHLQKHLGLIFVCLQKTNPLTILKENLICLFFNGNIAHITDWRALRSVIVAAVEWLKSLFVHAKFFWTHCFRTTHVPYRFNIANVIQRIRGECTTHRNCSQLDHTHLQRNIGFCRDVQFRDSYGWQFLYEKNDCHVVQILWWERHRNCFF